LFDHGLDQSIVYTGSVTDSIDVEPTDTCDCGMEAEARCRAWCAAGRWTVKDRAQTATAKDISMSDPSVEYIAGYAIKFSDGGDPEMVFLHKGTKKECDRVLDLIPAVTYSGKRPAAECFMFCIPSADLLGSQSQAGEQSK
jgi:hypothetical protein